MTMTTMYYVIAVKTIDIPKADKFQKYNATTYLKVSITAALKASTKVT